jgi:hypothetical protein
MTLVPIPPREASMTVRAVIIACVVGVLGLASLAQIAIPVDPPRTHDIRPGPGVTAVKMLSAYAPTLANTPGDTPVYSSSTPRP